MCSERFKSIGAKLKTEHVEGHVRGLVLWFLQDITISTLKKSCWSLKKISSRYNKERSDSLSGGVFPSFQICFSHLEMARRNQYFLPNIPMNHVRVIRHIWAWCGYFEIAYWLISYSTSGLPSLNQFYVWSDEIGGGLTNFEILTTFIQAIL